MKQIILFLALLIIAACGNPTSEEAAESAPQTSRDLATLFSTVPNFDTGRISKVLIADPINCTGQIDIPPTDMFSIHSMAGGYVKKLYYLEGDEVNAGAIMASMEDPKFISRQRELLELQSRLELANRNFERQKTLDAEGATTSKLYQAAEADWKELNASFNGLTSELEMMGFSTAQLLADGTYQRTLNLRAPATGIVQSIHVNVGQYIEPHDAIYELMGLDHTHLELNVLERDLPRISIGDSVRFEVAGLESEFKGEIVKIGAMVDNATGSLMAHCHIDDGPQVSKLRPGLFASARIFPQATEGYVLSFKAVVKEGTSYFGYVINNNELVRVPLRNARIFKDVVQFDATTEDLDMKWVTGGAYYIE